MNRMRDPPPGGRGLCFLINTDLLDSIFVKPSL